MINIQTTTGMVQVNEQNISIIEYFRKVKQVNVILPNGQPYDISHVKDFLPDGTPWEKLEKTKLLLKKNDILLHLYEKEYEAYSHASLRVRDMLLYGKVDKSTIEKVISMINEAEQAVNDAYQKFKVEMSLIEK